MSMTDRERTLATLLFRHPERVPLTPGGGRRSTLAAWRAQGLPEGADPFRHVCELLGLPPEVRASGPQTHVGLESRMLPMFEEKVLERKERSQIVQDWKGNICEISNEFDVTYLRHPMDFVTRRWLRCPVTTRAEWDSMRARYDARTPERLPADFAQRAEKLRHREYVSTISVTGPFWQLREWLGAEDLCLLFIDDPAWVEEMCEFWGAFIEALFARVFALHVPDVVLINEDMAFKAKAFISPAMVRRFLLPVWRRWAAQCQRAGVPVFEVDSDGYAGELIPLWIEAGLNCNSPLEAAAHNDLPAFRRQFGTRMAYRGGVDKRAMAAGGETLRKEIDRLRPVIEAGGFIPSCDHAIPGDVSWPNFVEYCRLLAQATGWL